MDSVGRESRKVRFAIRFIEAVEKFVGRPAPPVSQVAMSAANIANREALRGYPLTDAEFVGVIEALAPTWRYGRALRKWAVSRGYIKED